MRYVSTRGDSPPASLSEAIERGLATDGGLYVPESFPSVNIAALRATEGLPALAEALLTPFFAGDPLGEQLTDICSEAFNFPAPLRLLARDTAVLELFHGPTAAFKDFGARFLAAALARLQPAEAEPLTVLVATSGDTGGAVAAAFAGRPGFEVFVLYPAGMVSERQERQLTCWGGNVTALRVRGDFDACQRLVKEAFQDPSLSSRRRLTSANSISLGRLLPQMVYYAAASFEYELVRGAPAGFVIPSGNLGNATACFWARKAGLPIREIVLATNANETLTRFLSEGDWRPGATIQTLATAMDVGNPSNMERLLQLHGGDVPTRAELRARLVTDDEIRRGITEGVERWGQIWDPHTATAITVRESLDAPHWIVVSTAHPAKFESIVEPLIEGTVDVPQQLAELLDRPKQYREIAPELSELEARLG
ncbi:MAG: threonine synthase [Gemmatimonas sp.]|nr:threonine synthase [Gemmatimonas sp.]